VVAPHYPPRGRQRVARKALTLRYRETPRGGSSALRNDPTRFFIRLCNFYPVDRALAVKIEERLPVQSAPPVPIEGRRASAALRNGLRATRRVLECLHTRLPSAAVLRQDRARPPGWLGRRMGLLWW